uniref:Uncharacterized protein n=1 Tax=Tanacetum cinerariifolium TaxID=118510 RepID=A0A6L2LJN7_TANCI|nr:hypothetical protein [Tanacetum cinerariifolium]
MGFGSRSPAIRMATVSRLGTIVPNQKSLRVYRFLVTLISLHKPKPIAMYTQLARCLNSTHFQVWWRVQKRPIRYVSKEARHGQGIVGTRSIVINNVVNGRGPSMELVTAKEWEVRAFATIIAKPYESGYWTWKMHHEFDIFK